MHVHPSYESGFSQDVIFMERLVRTRRYNFFLLFVIGFDLQSKIFVHIYFYFNTQHWILSFVLGQIICPVPTLVPVPLSTTLVSATSM